MHRSSSSVGGGLLVVCGPSGVGKGSLLKLLIDKHPIFAKSVSHTSRSPRPGESNGVDYHFASKDDILQLVGNGMFIEHALVHGNVYGTSKQAVWEVQNSGKVCLLEIDVQGAKQVKSAEMNPMPKFVFVAPPSVEELEKRLRLRNTETEEKILLRMKNAEGEMQAAKEHGFFDAVIVNDDLQRAVLEFEGVLKSWYPNMF